MQYKFLELMIQDSSISLQDKFKVTYIKYLCEFDHDLVINFSLVTLITKNP
jgi:hypothetical protein